MKFKVIMTIKAEQILIFLSLLNYFLMYDYRVGCFILRTLRGHLNIENVNEYLYKIHSFKEEGCCFNLSDWRFNCRAFVKSYSVVNFYFVFERILYFLKNKYFQRIRVPSKKNQTVGYLSQSQKMTHL